jgi:hypothetical protein
VNRNLIFLLLIFILETANAAILTVSTDWGSQYTSIQTAIDTASPGDTILIAPSPGSYDGFTLNKRLTLVGAGIDTIPGRATLISSAITITDSADQSIIKSIWLRFSYQNSILVVQTGAEHILFEECFFENQYQSYYYPCIASISSSSVTFVKCGFWNAHYSNTNKGLCLGSGCEVYLYSCLFCHCGGYTITGGDETSILFITHTIFQDCHILSTSATGMVQNTASVGCYNQFQGAPNLACSYVAAEGVVPVGEGNFALIGGEFEHLVSQHPRRSDYHLTAGSPLSDAGNPASPLDIDGSRADIGIYGGQVPYDERGIPDFPFVIELNVPPIVPQNGTLNIGTRGRVGN